jgi:hypothetical protein
MKKLLIILLLIATPLYAETLYVCDGGDGSAPTSSTCSTAWDGSDFSNAGNWGVGANKISAGDTVNIKDDGGDYVGVTFTIQGSGTDGNVITIQAESSDEPMIDCNSAVDYGITSTDKEYFTIIGLNVKNCNKDGMYFNATADRTDVTLTDVYVDNTIINGIFFDQDAGFTWDNVTVQDSLITKWTRAADATVTTGKHTALFIQNPDGALVRRNKIDLLVWTGRTHAQNKVSDAINLHTPLNSIIEYNDITTLIVTGSTQAENSSSGHCITIGENNTPSVTCSGTIVRYNKLHDCSDDCFWSSLCSGDPLVHNNVCNVTLDDCWDIGGRASPNGSSALLYNNICIEPGSGIDTSGTDTTATVKNNIFIFTTAVSCDSDSNYHCFINTRANAIHGNPSLANWDIDNNIYYDATGTYGDSFVWSDGETNTYYTFAEWQALGDSPDASSNIENPMIDTTTGKPECETVFTTSASDQSLVFTSLLKWTAIWIQGNTPDLIGITTDWNVGAFAIKPLCADGFAVGGVTLDSVILN